MRNEEQVIARCDLYKRQLILAIEEKTASLVADPALDILILSLIDKLETLDWVLSQEDDDLDGGLFVLETPQLAH